MRRSEGAGNVDRGLYSACSGRIFAILLKCYNTTIPSLAVIEKVCSLD